MIETVLHEFTACLPLLLEDASWSDPVLSLSGSGWNFNSLSAWRLRNSERVLVGCSDSNAAEAVRRLIGQSVVRVFAQTSNLVVDPAFELSDGTILEVFATDTFEPWTLHLPSGRIFVASPSDLHAME